MLLICMKKRIIFEIFTGVLKCVDANDEQYVCHIETLFNWRHFNWSKLTESRNVMQEIQITLIAVINLFDDKVN